MSSEAPGPDERGPRTQARIALLAVLLAALALRSVGIDFGLPVWEEPDAVIAMHVDKLRAGDGSADPRWSDQNYPHLIARLVQPFGSAPPHPVSTEEHLAAAAHTHLQVRWAVAWLSLLALPGTWLLARRFCGAGGALLATGLMATSLLHFSFSQQGRPHAAAGSLFVLAVVASMRLARRGGTADYLWAGLAAGASLGVLQTGVFVLPALALGHLLRPGVRGARRWLDARALIPLGCLALAVRVFYPFLFGQQLGEDFGAPEVEGQRITMAEHSVLLSDFLDGRGFRVVLESLWNYDPVLLVGFALSLGVLALRRRGGGVRDPGAGRGRELAVALAFALPYLLVVGLFAKTYERFAIPLLPFAAASVGCAFERLAPGAAPGDRSRGDFRGHFRGRWPALAGILVLSLPAAACAKLALLRSRPDTLDQAARWIEANLTPNDPIALPVTPRMNTSFELPLLRRHDQLRDPAGKRIKQHSPWSRYQLAASRDGDSRNPEGGGDGAARRWNLRWLAPRTPAENRLMGRDYEAFILSLSPGYYVIEPYVERFDHPLFVDLNRILREHGRLVARFTPEGPQGKIEWPLFYMLSDHFNDEGHEAWPHFVPRLLRAEAIGPAVEIYRVDG